MKIKSLQVIVNNLNEKFFNLPIFQPSWSFKIQIITLAMKSLILMWWNNGQIFWFYDSN
jgi:hypothetical protein